MIEERLIGIESGTCYEVEQVEVYNEGGILEEYIVDICEVDEPVRPYYAFPHVGRIQAANTLLKETLESLLNIQDENVRSRIKTVLQQYDHLIDGEPHTGRKCEKYQRMLQHINNLKHRSVSSLFG